MKNTDAIDVRCVFINFSSSLFDIRYHTSCDLQNLSTQKVPGSQEDINNVSILN